MNWKQIITNKYILASVAFVALLFLSDRNSIIDQYKLRKQYNKVRAEHKYYEDKIIEAKQQKDELFTNDKNLEKFGREKYLMKREDEDVFVFLRKDSALTNNE